MQAGTQPPLLAPLSREDLGQLQIHLPALKIISFRGPGHSGGVASNLAPLIKQLDTKVDWFAVSHLPQGEQSQVPGFSFHRVGMQDQVTESQSRAVYDYLWPLLHGLTSRAVFDADAWKNFRQLSGQIAQHSSRVSSRSFPNLVWLHDFEMCLLPPMLPRDAGAVLCQFWHAPWPEAKVMVDSPVGKEIVESVLCNRAIGFHTAEYADNFLDTVQELLPEALVSRDALTVSYRGISTQVAVMPLGIDFQYWQRLARAARVEAESIGVRYRLANQVLLGVDRLDYTKGIMEKLDGIEQFLNANPDWIRCFHYVQLAQPADARSAALDSYKANVLSRVEEINARFAADGWEPIIFIEEVLGHQNLAAWYQAADVLMVTPVRDGLNLVAKEFIAARLDEQGALILSEQAGAAAELAGGALLVDASDAVQIGEQILNALAMPVEEKRRRMVSMRHVVGWNRLHDWACGFLRLAIQHGNS